MKVYQKEFDALTLDIVTDCYVFPNYLSGSMPSMLYYSHNTLWDTGSEVTIIAPFIAQELQLKPKSQREVVGIGGEQLVNIYEVTIALPNGEYIHNKEVYCHDLEDYDLLLGMDIISQTDFCITNVGGKTKFAFRTPSVGGIDLK